MKTVFHYQVLKLIATLKLGSVPRLVFISSSQYVTNQVEMTVLFVPFKKF